MGRVVIWSSDAILIQLFLIDLNETLLYINMYITVIYKIIDH
jgi:hypothetical protein